MSLSSDSDTITCKYSCHLYELKHIEVEVPIRDPKQDVVEWMDQNVLPTIRADHERQSPDCHPTELQQLIIPIPPGSQMVGRPVEH